jgi:predicted component of type VI protein secretion system
VVLRPKVESTMRLERVAPSGSDETIALDRPSLLLGRGHACDVKLRTPTASREHARVFFKDGQWMIAGVEGKSFAVDGKRNTGGEVRLQGGMRLRLGDDEFVVVDTTSGAVPSRAEGGLWARVVAFVRGLFGRRT